MNGQRTEPAPECEHGNTRVDANMVELLGGGFELRLGARCEGCRRLFFFDRHGLEAVLGCQLGPVDPTPQCACGRDIPGADPGASCRACVTEAAAVNKAGRS